MKELLKKNGPAFVKTLLFLLIGLFLLREAENVLRTPRGDTFAAGTGMDNVYKHKNQFDIVTAGTGAAVSNISNQELYESYGIAGVCIGEQGQTLSLSKYTLEDALRVQTPKVVFLDSGVLAFPDVSEPDDPEGKEAAALNRSLGVIRSPRLRTAALSDANIYYPDTRFWDCMSTLYLDHGNWKNLTKSNFTYPSFLQCMNGNVALFNFTDWRGDSFYEDSSPDELYEIPAESERYFGEIADLCEKKSAKLILVSGYVLTRAGHNAMQSLADRYGVTYIDLNEVKDEIGFSNTYDTDNGNYLNLGGAIRWSDYLGAYLKENFDMEDRREDSRYDWLKEQSPAFASQKEFMETKQKLAKSDRFDDYLYALAQLDYSRFIVFMSIEDEGSHMLSEAEFNLLESLGLKESRNISFRGSYAAVLGSDGPLESVSADEAASISGTDGGVQYTVKSSGFNSGGIDAGVIINAVDRIYGSRGINVVVWDKEFNTLVNSSVFDTYEEENPVGRQVQITEPVIFAE